MNKTGTTLYRFLSGPDDSTFCHKVSKALSQGWQLYGQPIYTFDAKEGVMRCGQAVTKDTDEPYDSDRKLADY